MAPGGMTLGGSVAPMEPGNEVVSTDGAGSAAVLQKTPASVLGQGIAPSGPSITRSMDPGLGEGVQSAQAGGMGAAAPGLVAPPMEGRVTGISDLPTPTGPGVSNQVAMDGRTMSQAHTVDHAVSTKVGKSLEVSPEAVSPATSPNATPATQGGIGDVFGKMGTWIKDNPAKSLMMAGAAYMLFNPPQILNNLPGGSLAKLPMLAALGYGAYQMFKNVTNNNAPGSGPAPTGKTGGAAAAK